MNGKVRYTKMQGAFRPYLEVFFSNPANSKTSSRTLAMIDSGADQTVIPFSIGSQLELQGPTEQEKLKNAAGVGGGNVSFLERNCRIYVLNRKKDKLYVFSEVIWWIYPDNQTMSAFQKLIEEYGQFQQFKEQTKEKTELEKYFFQQMERVMHEIKIIQTKLEPSILLGRPFFDNFDYIQFCHKDRKQEESYFFNYRVSKNKPVEIIELNTKRS